MCVPALVLFFFPVFFLLFYFLNEIKLFAFDYLFKKNVGYGTESNWDF